MNIVFCADRRVLPGLHVAMYSLLARIGAAVSQTRFFLFSDDVTDADFELLRQTLSAAGKNFTLERQRVDAKLFANFLPLNGSCAAYYRLVVPQALDVERFLYLDADTLCDVDVSELNKLDLRGAPAALVPEAPLAGAIDRFVAEQLGNSATEPYYNSGVMLVDVPAWRRQRVTERALEYISAHRPPFHDQSALNVVLRGNAVTLDERFNCIANMRKHWPALRVNGGSINRLVHFVDYPKPWDLFGEFVNPHYQLWRTSLEKTALKNFRSWQKTPARKFPKSQKALAGYKKSLKDRWLCAGYARGWLKKVKGVPAQNKEAAV
jgi:lipopolysaccharide biosynthesis glycosyltransferase